MQVYPAYTIELIETELSWRQVNALIDLWPGEGTTVAAIAKIEKMIADKLGFKKLSSKPLSSASLENRLMEEGFL